MIIQSKRVWVCGHFMEAQLEMEDGKIKKYFFIWYKRSR